jgi:predicted amidophosphoribosyltransferase
VAKFCGECGFNISESAAFCGGCGAKIERVCPTCGQNLPKGMTAKVSGGNSRGEKSSTNKGQPDRRVTSNNQPIYGIKYNEDEDCPNCGAKGQKDFVCKQCGEDSY